MPKNKTPNNLSNDTELLFMISFALIESIFFLIIPYCSYLFNGGFFSVGQNCLAERLQVQLGVQQEFAKSCLPESYYAFLRMAAKTFMAILW